VTTVGGGGGLINSAKKFLFANSTEHSLLHYTVLVQVVAFRKQIHNKQLTRSYAQIKQYSAVCTAAIFI
jgi:hypothetical protein